LCAEARVEGTAFYEKRNKSAGTRLRAKMAEIAVLCKATRVDVQAIKNADK
jgi:hypothetical protein